MLNKISNTYIPTHTKIGQRLINIEGKILGKKTQKQTSTKYQIHISSKTLTEKY